MPKAPFAASEAVGTILSWAESSDFDLIILSSEAFASALRLRDTFTALAATFDIHVVVFFREQTAYANSLYNQLLKLGLFRPEDGRQLALVRSIEIRSYVEIARLWRDASPDGRLSVVALEPGDDAWSAFAAAVGPALFDITPTGGTQNPSLRPEALAFINWFAGTNRGNGPEERGRIASILNDYSAELRKLDPAPITLLEPATEDYIRARAEPVNLALSREFLDGRPIFPRPAAARHVDLDAIGPAEVLRVADHVFGRYDRQVADLRARLKS